MFAGGLFDKCNGFCGKGSGFRVLGFRVQGLGFRGLGFRVSGFRVQGLGCWPIEGTGVNRV